MKKDVLFTSDLLLNQSSIDYAIEKLDFVLVDHILELQLDHLVVSINIETFNNECNKVLIQTNINQFFDCFNKKKATQSTNYLENKTLIDNYCLKALYSKALRLNDYIGNSINTIFNIE
jgi:hypothetical protein